MKLKHLLITALAALPVIAAARPAYPGLITVSNPDGTTLKVRAYGDEKFNYYTDAANTMIMENGADGYWRQASRFGRMLTPVARDINVLKAEVLPVQQAMSNMALLDAAGQSQYPTATGEKIRSLVVLLEFNGTPFSVPNPQHTFSDMLNKPGFSEYGACGSAHDYYLDSSNGKFDLTFDVTEVVPLKHNSAWYNGLDLNPTNKNRRWGSAIVEALEYLDDKVDFSQYDLDNDGCIDNIFFFYSGYGQADTGVKEYIWPHQGSYYNYVAKFGSEYDYISVDGKQMRTYACANELIGTPPPGKSQPYLDGIGGFCHEYGHVIGLPDMYDTVGANTITPGYYTVMDQGSYNNYSTCPPRFSAYEQYVCRWITPNELEVGDHAVIPTMSEGGDAVCYRLGIPKPLTKRTFNEWYFFETRTKSSWDTYLPDHGMMIWYVNYENKQLWENNLVNSTGIPNIQLLPSSDGVLVWPGSENAIFSYPGSANQLTFKSKNPYYTIWLTEIAYDEETKTSEFKYNAITEQPQHLTVMHANPSLASDPEVTAPEDGREFVLTWDAVEGATGYQVTVIRTDSRGVERYVDDLNDKYVGNVTSLLVSNMTATAWKQDFKAYVRVVAGVPSSEISNTIEFKPEMLAYTLGVEDVVADDFDVIGGNGFIIAPEGAEIFAISGMRCSANDLAAGVYLVKYGKNVKKVVVK